MTVQLAKFVDPAGQPRVALVQNSSLVPLRTTDRLPTLQSILAADDPVSAMSGLQRDRAIRFDDVPQWLPPIDAQEVWAAGVTYKRSQVARMEESESAASCYDRVYGADRPEIFFKATPSRVVGHEGELRIRADSTWDVPEPEITLVLSPSMRIVGLTVGNDMSSRSIEGENPLYLPQAKTYDQCAGLGPWITLVDSMPELASLTVDLQIKRGGEVVFEGQTAADQMARRFEDLVKWLGRDNTLAAGAFLMTGTGIVPTSAFTLAAGDVVEITVGGVGTLRNRIVRQGR